MPDTKLPRTLEGEILNMVPMVRREVFSKIGDFTFVMDRGIIEREQKIVIMQNGIRVSMSLSLRNSCPKDWEA